ncbi:MAG: hypothetical protein EBZ59_02915 [Planctomycetia bacterium]|nr:hypothetical protein [Planctomycetia bacterium]
MVFSRVTVYFPCHTLEDFPTWLDEAAADDLLSAWTAAWHPSLLAGVGRIPTWASVDQPPRDADSILGIVPASWDDRFAGSIEGVCTPGASFVRQVSGRDAILAAAGVTDVPPADPPAADFHALGLAWLLSELLARRMRSSTGLDDAFEEAAVAAARAATAGDAAAARDRLRECFGCLEAARSRYYPVDVWLLDLVLLAPSTLGRSLEEELDSPVPAAFVATGELLDSLAARNPAALEKIRRRCAAGMLAPAGGRDDARPVDGCTPERLLDSFRRGRAAWSRHVGVRPVTYAQCTGGSSAILPQLLGSLGYAGAVWSLFDGTVLPDPGTSRVRWEGTGGACIDAVAGAPLDARRARTILSLPERIGDAMDRDHTAILQFAHHPGTASPWFDAFRRIGGWTTALGRFVTPDELFRQTAGAGSVVSFEPDRFPPAQPPESAGADPVGDHVADVRDEARRLLDARAVLADRAAAAAASAGSLPPVTATVFSRPDRVLWRMLTGGLFASGRAGDEEVLLANDRIHVHVHRATGGILSLRRPGDGRNRLSQRLSLRTTRPAPQPGEAWETVDERAEHARMLADAIERVPADGVHDAAILSRGRLVDAGDGEVGHFVQRLSLAGNLPVVLIEIEIRLARSPAGPMLEEHAACRFAWSENEDVEMCRSLHTQSIVTERSRFTAPHFIELHAGGREGAAASAVTIFTCGLPWHIRTGPHTLDSILLTRGGLVATRRMAVGIGVDRPWDLALALAAERTLQFGGALLPPNVRLTVGQVVTDGDRIAAARIGLLESSGRDGEVRVEWPSEVAAVRRCDPSDPVDATVGGCAEGVAVEGRVTTVHLRRYEWTHLELMFRQPPSVAAGDRSAGDSATAGSTIR